MRKITEKNIFITFKHGLTNGLKASKFVRYNRNRVLLYNRIDLCSDGHLGLKYLFVNYKMLVITEFAITEFHCFKLHLI